MCRRHFFLVSPFLISCIIPGYEPGSMGHFDKYCQIWFCGPDFITLLSLKVFDFAWIWTNFDMFFYFLTTKSLEIVIHYCHLFVSSFQSHVSIPPNIWFHICNIGWFQSTARRRSYSQRLQWWWIFWLLGILVKKSSDLKI